MKTAYPKCRVSDRTSQGKKSSRAPFLDAGWEVVGFDSAPMGAPGFDVIQGGLTESHSVDRALADCDVVVHVGATGDVYPTGEQPALPSQARQFTHASDIGRAFVLAAESEVSGLAINIVAPGSITIRELAERVAAKFPTPLSFGEPRPGDVSPAHVSSKRVTDILGRNAEVSSDEGLDELISDVIGVS